MKHVLLYQDWLEGWQYGTHKALEDEIIKQTGAEIVTLPNHAFEQKNRRIEHGRTLQFARKWLTKMDLNIEADVAWHVLMSPGDYNLDLFKSSWYKNIKHRIVYVFDTLQPIEKALISAFSDDTFTLRITSFNDAVPYMERITGKKWHYIEQATAADFFSCPPESERLIPFASYGRRDERFHKILKEFIQKNNLYYDFSTYNGTMGIKFDPYVYKHYAWHVAHSCFNVCWPVELTSPSRAGSLSPITCRWFEVAAAGTPIIGKKPKNKLFDELLHPELIIELDLDQSDQLIYKSLEKIWSNKSAHIKHAKELREQNLNRWTWQNRVERMLDLIDGNH